VIPATPVTPAGNGDLLVEPPFEQWAILARESAAAAAEWDFRVAGTDARALRARARTQALEIAAAYCERLGIPALRGADVPDLVVATGHQPELYHPGVWAKDFLLQRLADLTGATALDVVVDSDGFETVGIHAPCLEPDARVCRTPLATGGPLGWYARAALPSPEQLREFREGGRLSLATLPVPGPLRDFGRFCDALESAADTAHNLAELVTAARRHYEADAGTDYLELPVTSMSQTDSFALFVAHLALDAPAFAAAYNGALADFRSRTATRSAAQPFPDLVVSPEAVELPFWHLGDARRTVWARSGDRPALMVDGEVICELDPDPAQAALALTVARIELAPKALALTLFVRMFVADLFIHGVGGGRYDQVTDQVARTYFGVEAPAFVVASLTIQLPLGIPVVQDSEIEEVAMALNRIEHNPDQMLEAGSLGPGAGSDRAALLVEEKRGLVAAIALPGADKKSIGARIREVNAELAALLEPVRRGLADRAARLEAARDARDAVTDRTYPFCYWEPREIAQSIDAALEARVRP
jgi:hypothetical protein